MMMIKKGKKRKRKEAESNIIDFITITVTILIDIIKFSFPSPCSVWQEHTGKRDIELAWWSLRWWLKERKKNIK